MSRPAREVAEQVGDMAIRGARTMMLARFPNGSELSNDEREEFIADIAGAINVARDPEFAQREFHIMKRAVEMRMFGKALNYRQALGQERAR